MRILRLTFAAGIALLFLALPAFPQNQTTGAITGRAMDSTGALIPGVEVTISSPSMIGGSRTTPTDEQGSFRFTLLAAGTYRVSFALSGFKTLNIESVDVNAGATRTINGTMEVATVAEEVTVTSQAPTIDLEAATVGVNWDLQKLDNLPYARSGTGLMTMIPGFFQTSFDVGGSNFATGASGVQGRTYGRSGNAVVSIDGTIWCMTYADYGSFEEVNVSMASKGAEQMNAGLTVSMVIKSGGNQFHGGFSGDYERGSFQSKNVDDKLLKAGYNPGSNKFTKLREVYGDISGPIKRNKLWFYFTYRDSYSGNFIPGFISMKTGQQAEFYSKLQGPTAKLTYQLTQNQKIETSWQMGLKWQPYRSAGKYVPLEASQNQHSWLTVGPTLKWTYIIGPKMTATAGINRGGYWWPDYDWADPGEVRKQDQRSNAALGPQFNTYRRPIRWTWNSDVSYFNEIGGKNNEMKFGYYGWWDKAYTSNFGYPLQSIFRYRSLDTEDFVETTPDNLRRLFNRPDSVEIFDYPNKVAGRGDYTAFYINDKITWNRKLTLNAGLRLDRFSSYQPEQGNSGEGPFSTRLIYPQVKEGFPVYTKIVPRLSFAYDVTGNGKLALKASYGRYISSSSGPNAQPGPSAASVNPNATKSCIFNNWDGSIPYVPTGTPASCSNGNWDPVTRKLVASSATRRLAPDLEADYLDEFTAGLEVGFSRDYSLRFNIVRKFNYPGTKTLDLAQPYESFTDLRFYPDPGPDGVTGNSDDPGKTIYVWSVPRTFPTQGQTNDLTVNVRPGEGKDQYTAYELTFNKQLSNKWSFLGSYSIDLAHESGNDPINPNQAVYVWDLPVWRQAFKMNGTYALPWGLMWGSTYTAQSGDWFSRTVQVRNALNTNVTVTVEGQVGRYPWVNLWDNRVSKRFKIGDTQSIEGIFDLFNTSNVNAITGWTTQSGSTYHRPSAIISPRIFKLSARYKF
jgi:hypothetical protein